MPAPKNNQFWKQRSKHGRDYAISDPDNLWECASEYFEWCDKNPLITIEYNGKDAIECRVPKMRAYTYAGLCQFIGCDIETFHKTKKREGFIDIYTRICNIIYTQKFEGAAAGLLNASIIARDLGLKDATDVTTGGDKLKPGPSLDLSNVPLETLKELAKHIDDTETKE